MDYDALAQSVGGTAGDPYEALASRLGGRLASTKPDRGQVAKDALTSAAGSWNESPLLINLGAGIDSAIKGIQSLVGAGPSDQQIQDKRALDRALADTTTGGGVVQFAGEMLPTLAIPGSGFVKGGMALARMAPVAARLGTAAAVGDAAIGGAIAGASQLTSSDESKLVNAIAGAVGGAGLSGLIAAGKPIAQLLTQGGAEAKAAAKLVAMMGGPTEAEAALAKVRAYVNPANEKGPSAITRNIPMSAAEIAQNPSLGRAERTAQARYTEDWAPFRADQAQERYQSLIKATNNDLSGVTKARADASAPLRNEALQAAEGQDFTTPVQAASSWMREGSAGTNPAVQSITNYVDKNIGPNATPEQLYTVRKTLLAKLNGKAQLGDELSAATKQARRETMAMVNAIDDSLDGVTGGAWTPYLKEYASKSGEVDSAEALTLIRKSFDKESAPQFAGVPAVTGTRLARSIEKYGENSYGSKLTPDARQGLQELQDNVDMTEGLQKLLKLTGTSGGGSNTAMDLTGLAQAAAQNKLTTVIPVLNKLVARSDEMTQAAVSDALRNPQLFISGVSKKLAQSRPLTRTEENVLALLRSVGAGATLGLVAPQ